MTNWLEFNDVSFGYNKTNIMENWNFSIADNHCVLGILGPSGVGKTTLLHLVAGFLQIDSGSIAMGGNEICESDASRPIVFQDHNLFPWMSVIDNICFGLKAKGLSVHDRYAAVVELLQQTGLSGHESKYPAELSGGMQQRVGLARAMAIKPECILLDEPFASLDENTAQEVRNYFIEQLQRTNMKAVYVTHSLSAAVDMCDALLVMNDKDSPQIISSLDDLGNSSSARTESLRSMIFD